GNDAKDEKVADEVANAKKFAPARYGYAVETYATALVSSKVNLPTGYKIAFQVGRGMTRPDIVVTDDKKKDRAWFDITSEESEGHIKKKFGAGWATTPFVAELTYPKLDLEKVGTGDMAIGNKVALKNRLARLREHWEQGVADYKSRFDDEWKKD